MTEAGSARSCSQRCITAWGWFFDAATVLISLSDVASDIMVAVQFYGDGHMVWFGLVMASLLISNIVYTVYTCEIWRADISAIKKIPRPLWYLAIFPIAQLMPVINYFKELVTPSSLIDLRHFRSDWKANTSTMTRYRKEEMGAIAGSMTVMQRLETALFDHLRSHTLFFIETVVEAIPQSIIQLLAITFLGQATWVQVLSMSLSMVSIVSKAYILSYSFTVKMFCFKFLLISHDVFSLFYIFSTLLSKDTQGEHSLFGTSLKVTTISYIWVLKVLIFCFVEIIWLIVIGVFVLIERLYNNSHKKCETIGFSILVVLLAILLAIPVALAEEGCKLITLILFIVNVEPTQRSYPLAVSIYSFCHRGNYKERLRHCILSSMYPPIQATESRNPGKLEDFSRYHFDGTHDPNDENQILPSNRHAYIVCHRQPFCPNDIWWKGINEVSFSNWSHLKCHEQAFSIFSISLTVIFTIGQVYSFIFPFLDFGLHRETLNLLQYVCFVALSVSLLLALFLTVHAVRYVLFALQASMIFSRRVTKGNNGMNLFAAWMADYYTPRHVAVLRKAVPTSLIPYDVISVVGTFMQPQDIDVTDMSVEELKRYMEKDTIALEKKTDYDDAETVEMHSSPYAHGEGYSDSDDS